MTPTYTDVIETTYGKIRGIQKEGYQEFKGIRYAIARRFQKAELYQAPETVYDATSYGYTCPQPGQPAGSFYDREFWHFTDYRTPLSEDCLYLNIWRPDHAENCPVILWIHGGAYMNGFGSKVEIDGKFWNARGIILVSINYRLGVSAFLTCKLLDDAYGYSGNLGIYDQLTAIEWVRKHIRSFGGDPDRIILAGQSAGAMSVQTLLGSPILPQGIAGAIMQSGGGIDNWMNESISKEDMQVLHEEYLQEKGISTLDQLLNADMMNLVWSACDFAQKKKGGKLLFIPHMSTDILPDTYENLTKAGKVRNVPCVIGCTRNDITVTGDDVEGSPIYQGCLNWAQALKAVGHKPNYVYVFERKPLGGEGQGAFHSSDLWYSFHTLERSWREKTEEDYQTADEMNRRWADFVLYGTPNDEEEDNGIHLKKWNAYQSKKDVYPID